MSFLLDILIETNRCLLNSEIIVRSKVECGGQCMANSECEAFNYVDQICKLLKTEFLFKDVTPQTEVYVPPTTSPGSKPFEPNNDIK